MEYLAVLWVLAGLVAVTFTWRHPDLTPTESGDHTGSVLLLIACLLGANVCAVGAILPRALDSRG